MNFNEDGIDDTILVVLGLARKARDETVDDKGDEEMLIVDVVQGEHRTAAEQELRGKSLKAKGFEGNTLLRLDAAGEGGQRGQQEKPS